MVDKVWDLLLRPKEVTSNISVLTTPSSYDVRNAALLLLYLLERNNKKSVCLLERERVLYSAHVQRFYGDDVVKP